MRDRARGPRWGSVLPGDRPVDPDGMVVGRSVAEAGYDELWTGEVAGLDAVTTLALAGAGARALAPARSARAPGMADDAPEVGIGLATMLSIYHRAPSIMAMTAATLASSFPGQVTIALGASSPLLVDTWNGIPFQRPVARTRDLLRFLRAALAGEKVAGPFETFASKGFRLTSRTAVPPRLLVAAAGPQMLALAVKEADGVLLNWCAADDLDRMPLPDDRARVSVFVNVCAEPDPVVARAIARPLLGAYLAAPAYAGHQVRMGRGELLAPMWELAAKGDWAGATAAVPDEAIDALIVHGSPAECRERLAAMVTESGVRPIVHALGPPDRTLELIRALGPG